MIQLNSVASNSYSYNPNLNDSRVTARIRHALGFSLGVLSTTKPHQWSTRYIDKHFGSQSNELSNWLRDVLLINTNNHYSMETGKCKEYLLNNYGVSYLKKVLQGKTGLTYVDYCASTPRVVDITKNNKSHITYPSVVHLSKYDMSVVFQWAKREYGQELAELKFNYKDQSSRLWHPIQNIKSECKKALLAEQGLKFQYDIQCSAPTLILQNAQQLDMDLYLGAIRKYILDRTAVRNELAEAAEVPVKDIKILINALFCGARLGNNKEFALSKLLKHDEARIKYLQGNEFVVALKDDIKTCWQYIEKSMYKTYVKSTKTGNQRKKPLTSKAKWVRYFDLERQVLNAVQLYLAETNNKAFLEHDGWTCEKEINQGELLKFVKSNTGYTIKLDSEMFESK